MNEAVPSRAPQNPQVPIEEGAMSNVEIRPAIHCLSEVLSIQVSRDARVQVNPNANTSTSRIRDFTWMNPPIFYGSKVEKDPKGFIDEAFKVVNAMGYSSKEKVKLAAYQPNAVAQVWYEHSKDGRSVIEDQITWEDLKMIFIDSLFPLELTLRKMQEFINHRQGGMSLNEHSRKFTQLCSYYGCGV